MNNFEEADNWVPSTKSLTFELESCILLAVSCDGAADVTFEGLEVVDAAFVMDHCLCLRFWWCLNNRVWSAMRAANWDEVDWCCDVEEVVDDTGKSLLPLILLLDAEKAEAGPLELEMLTFEADE